MFPRQRNLRILLACITGSILGCNPGDAPLTYPVSGIVEYGGAPVAAATVTFHPVDKDIRTAVARTNEKGEFQLTTVKDSDGAMPGKYRVTVTKMVNEGGPLTPSTDIAAPPPPVKIKAELPAKFGSPETSGLEVTVEAISQNELDVAIPK